MNSLHWSSRVTKFRKYSSTRVYLQWTAVPPRPLNQNINISTNSEHSSPLPPGHYSSWYTELGRLVLQPLYIGIPGSLLWQLTVTHLACGKSVLLLYSGTVTLSQWYILLLLKLGLVQVSNFYYLSPRASSPRPGMELIQSYLRVRVDTRADRL